jgi:hypothetical protein
MRHLLMIMLGVLFIAGGGLVYGIDSPVQGVFDYPIGFDSRPHWVKTADFNNDGAPDVMTLNWLDETFSVFLQDQGQISQTPIITDVGIEPGNLVLSDFNNDGVQDAIVINYETDATYMRVLVGDGTGAFTTASTTDVGSPDWSMGGATAADYTGDGYNDIALASTWSAGNVVTLYVNDGTGGFLEPVIVWSGDIMSGEEGYHSICSFDADGDGDIDLVGAIHYEKLVAVYYNPGDGSFTYENRATFPASQMIWRIHPADFDADGDIDMAVGGLVIMENDGAGSFSQSFEMEAWANVYFPVDLDGDSDLDLVGSTPINHKLRILKNNGTGNFQEESIRDIYMSPRSVCAADFDGDGDNDLAIAREIPFQTSYVSFLYNAGNGFFPRSSDYHISRQGTPGDIAIADLDGDGDNDVISTAPSINIEDYMLVLINNGYGKLQEPDAYLVGDMPRSIVASDLDGDGDVDVVTGNDFSDDISVLLNNGDATYQDAVTYPAGNSPDILAADMDNDSDMDLISTNFYSGDLSLLLNNGDATFVAPTTIPVDANYAIQATAADFDDDNDIDLAVLAREPYMLVIYLNDGSAGLTAAGSLDVEGCRLESGDFDGDGDYDLAVTQRSDNSVAILLNNGDATFMAGDEYTAGDAPEGIVAADLNGDGIPDLGVVNNDTHNLSFFSGLGGGMFADVINLAIGYNPCDISTGDLDGDGDLDIIVTNHLNTESDMDGSLSILFNQSNTPFLCGDSNSDTDINVGDVVFLINYVFSGGSAPEKAGAADANGDGQNNVADAVYLLNYIFNSGPPPIC